MKTKTLKGRRFTTYVKVSYDSTPDKNSKMKSNLHSLVEKKFKTIPEYGFKVVKVNGARKE